VVFSRRAQGRPARAAVVLQWPRAGQLPRPPADLFRFCFVYALQILLFYVFFAITFIVVSQT
jgi:hypothetical protein